LERSGLDDSDDELEERLWLDLYVLAGLDDLDDFLARFPNLRSIYL
jgi:hypothetical protein